MAENGKEYVEEISNDGPLNDWFKTRSMLLQFGHKLDRLSQDIERLRNEVRLARERPTLKRRCKYCRRKNG